MFLSIDQQTSVFGNPYVVFIWFFPLLLGIRSGRREWDYWLAAIASTGSHPVVSNSAYVDLSAQNWLLTELAET